MKAKYLLLAATTCACSVALAEPIQLKLGEKANLELYGTVQLAVENVQLDKTYGGGDPTLVGPNNRLAETPAASRFRLTNNRSILGFRGDINVNDDLKGVWQIESSVAAEGGVNVPAQTWANRNSGVGLDSKKYGRIIMGNWQTPYTHSTFGYDPFYTTTGAYMNIMGNGSGPNSNPNRDPVSFDRRENSSVQYWSPDMSGVKVRFGFDLGDNKTPASPGTLARNPYLVSLETTYEKGPLNATFAYESHHQFQEGGGNDTGIKVGAAYWFGKTRVAGMLQRLQYQAADGDLKQSQYYVSAVHKLTEQDLLKLSYAVGGEVSGTSRQIIGYLLAGPQSGSKMLTVGAEHQFNQYLATFAYYSKTYNENRAFKDFPINDVYPSMGADPSVVAVGLRLSF